MIKWKLLITTLPYVIVILGIKLFLDKVLHFKTPLEFSDIGLLFTGGVFIMGFILAGTMTDYKESEKIPAEIACTLEGIEEIFVLISASKPSLNLAHLRQELLEVTDKINDWLYNKIDITTMYNALEKLGVSIKQKEFTEVPTIAARALGELNTLRKTITRINVISKTGFISSAYALLETLIFAIIIILFIVSFKNILSEVILTSFLSLIYIYLYRLIRDIDNPFEYSEKGAKGASEIKLFPIQEYRERLRKRCNLT